MIWTKSFWQGLGERAIKTFFQTVVAVASAGVVGNTTGLTDVDWGFVISASLMATLLSAATSIGNPEFVSGTDKEVQVDHL